MPHSPAKQTVNAPVQSGHEINVWLHIQPPTLVGVPRKSCKADALQGKAVKKYLAMASAEPSNPKEVAVCSSSCKGERAGSDTHPKEKTQAFCLKSFHDQSNAGLNTTMRKKSNLSLSSYAAHRCLRKKTCRWQADTRQGRLPERKERGSDASCEPVPSANKAESRLDPSVCKTRHALRGVTATNRKDGLLGKSCRGSFSKVRQKPEKSLREAVEPLDGK